MDPKKIAIAGSIASVLIGLVVVGLLYYRQAALEPGPVDVETPTTDASVPTENDGVIVGQVVSPIPAVSAPAVTEPPSDVPVQPPDYTQAPDTDKDGLVDPLEITNGTDPKKADTDGDGYTDTEEMYDYGTSPRDPASKPAQRSVKGPDTP